VRLAAVAGVVSHVREDEPGIRFARRLALPARKGSEAAMSGLRFRRLLAVQEPDELYPALLRALRLAGLKADIADLARSAYLWTHPKWIDGIRHEWAFAYYAQAPSEK
jgi:CRISPR system Cascade subunit CasB